MCNGERVQGYVRDGETMVDFSGWVVGVNRVNGGFLVNTDLVEMRSGG